MGVGVVVAGEEIGDNWLLQILFIVAKHIVYHIKFVKLPKLFLSLLGVLRIYFEIWEVRGWRMKVVKRYKLPGIT